MKVETKICAIWGTLEANLKQPSTLKFIMNISFLPSICNHRSIILIFREKKCASRFLPPRKIFFSAIFDFHFREYPHFHDEFQALLKRTPLKWKHASLIRSKPPQEPGGSHTSSQIFFFFFFFVFPSYISGVHHFWVRFWRMWPFFNPTFKVVTFRLCGRCVLGVFFLPAFTRLGHERQDLLSPCDEMHVCTD